MGIKEDYQQALALAQEGKFEQARSLLITHDHQKTNALLKKVNDAIASGRGTAPEQKKVNKPRKTSKITKALLVIAMLAMIGLASYYYVQVYIPAQGQAAQIEDALRN